MSQPLEKSYIFTFWLPVGRVGPTTDCSRGSMIHSGSEGLPAGREVICVVFGMQVGLYHLKCLLMERCGR